MAKYLHEPALPEFYQFLCGTGQFDLHSIKPELWDHTMKSNQL